MKSGLCFAKLQSNGQYKIINTHVVLHDFYKVAVDDACTCQIGDVNKGSYVFLQDMHCYEAESLNSLLYLTTLWFR